MTLDTGGPVNFKPRPVEGAPDESQRPSPQSLLLDGQQRMTSLYQVTLRGKVVETVTPKKKKVKRWFYIDIRKALDPSVDREEAIVGVPEDRIIRTDFGREVDPGPFVRREGIRVAHVSRSPRSSTGTNGKTGSTSTGAATRTRACARNSGPSNDRFWKTSSTTACR